MKYLLFAAALVATAPAHAADVGLSLNIGQPGFFGHIDIGDFPAPQVIYTRPRLMYRQAVARPSIYLHVPPSHAQNWSRHCREYNACSERVYFVQDNWYEREYVPRYQERHGNRHDNRRDDRRDDHGNDRHDNGRGHGGNH